MVKIESGLTPKFHPSAEGIRPGRCMPEGPPARAAGAVKGVPRRIPLPSRTEATISHLFPGTLPAGNFLTVHFMRKTRLIPLLAALAFAPFIHAGIGDYPQAVAPEAPSGKEWESEQMLGLNKEK